MTHYGDQELHPPAKNRRGDALAQSQHSRLDQVEQPLADFDQEKAASLCAELCRNRLQDYAPALLLLPAPERRRAQSLVAYVHTLFDFAAQQGMEGERLAELNRWEFRLEQALDGEPVGQPIFLRLADEERRRPWSREAFDRLGESARLRVSQPRPADPEKAQAQAESLAMSFCAALLDEPPTPALSRWAGAVLQLHAIQNVGEDLRQRRCALPTSVLPDVLTHGGDVEPDLIGRAVRQECQRLDPLLRRLPGWLEEVSSPYRRAARFTALAAQLLLDQCRRLGPALMERPARLGLLSRLVLLIRMRLG